MMKRIQMIEISTYEYQNGYYFDIVRKHNENICEIWLYHKNSGIKKHIVGASVEGTPPTEDQMLQIVEDFFANNNTLDDYKTKYNTQKARRN